MSGVAGPRPAGRARLTQPPGPTARRTQTSHQGACPSPSPGHVPRAGVCIPGHRRCFFQAWDTGCGQAGFPIGLGLRPQRATPAPTVHHALPSPSSGPPEVWRHLTPFSQSSGGARRRADPSRPKTTRLVLSPDPRPRVTPGDDWAHPFPCPSPQAAQQDLDLPRRRSLETQTRRLSVGKGEVGQQISLPGPRGPTRGQQRGVRQAVGKEPKSFI